MNDEQHKLFEYCCEQVYREEREKADKLKENSLDFDVVKQAIEASKRKIGLDWGRVEITNDPQETESSDRGSLRGTQDNEHSGKIEIRPTPDEDKIRIGNHNHCHSPPSHTHNTGAYGTLYSPYSGVTATKVDPPEPVVGEMLYDSCNGSLLRWDGENWVAVESDNEIYISGEESMGKNAITFRGDVYLDAPELKSPLHLLEELRELRQQLSTVTDFLTQSHLKNDYNRFLHLSGLPDWSTNPHQEERAKELEQEEEKADTTNQAYERAMRGFGEK